MQALTAAPRDGLTAAQVTAILTGPSLQVAAGLERLRPSDLAVVEDLSAELEGGQVKRSNYATVHGTCALRITRLLAWGSDLVRPYVTLSDGATSARWNLGVFSLATPKRTTGESPTTYAVDGYDRLYLLAREVGDTWEAPAGAKVLDEVRRAITAAGLTGVYLDPSANAATLPSAMVWPLVPAQGDNAGPATWLRVVNDLLATVNYRGLYADQDGLYRSEPYRPASEVAPEWTFSSTDPRTILGDQRTLTEDLYRAPNRWVFIQQNRPEGAAAPTVGDGLYVVVNQSDGQASIDARGLTWTRQVRLDAADQTSLVAAGDRIVAADRRVTASLELRTAPFPGAGHFDVFRLEDDELGTAKWQAAGWTVDLGEADTLWTWERVA